MSYNFLLFFVLMRYIIVFFISFQPKSILSNIRMFIAIVNLFLILLLGMLLVNRFINLWKRTCSCNKPQFPSFLIFSFLHQLPISSLVSQSSRSCDLLPIPFTFIISGITQKAIFSQNISYSIEFFAQVFWYCLEISSSLLHIQETLYQLLSLIILSLHSPPAPYF